MKNSTMYSFFDFSGEMAKPWAKAGCICYCVDIQHNQGAKYQGNNIFFVGADIEHYIPKQSNIIFASFFPPCTDLAVSGARWFKDKGLRRLSRAIALFARSVEIAESFNCPWIIENPVSTISTYWRKPDHTFHPYEYGDGYTKKTCLWSGNGFIMPDKNPVQITEKNKIHYASPGPDRANIRSKTPGGFARAVFLANYKPL